jgi:hypothetical protein
MFIFRLPSIRQAERKGLPVVAGIDLDADYELPNVSHAGHTSSLFPGSAQHGHQQAHQKGNHGNDNEQLNQGEGSSLRSKTPLSPSWAAI